MNKPNINIVVSGAKQAECTYKNVVLKGNHSFASQVTEPNCIYTIKWDFDLNGEDVTIPENCVLEFDGGSLNNGTIIGKNTKLSYNAAFLNNCTLEGTFNSETIISDSIFRVFDTSSERDVKNLFHIIGKENKINISKHTFTNFGEIGINRNVDVDFNGSTIKCLLETTPNIQSSVFTTPVGNRADAFVLDYVNIKNVTIIGKETYTYDKAAQSFNDMSVYGNQRWAFKLFNVKDISLININLQNYDCGRIQHEDFWDYVKNPIVCYYYKTLLIDGLNVHDSGTSMNIVKAIPVIGDNYAEVKNCHAYNEYCSFLQVLDGICDVHDNICEDYDGSALNTFCYNSKIHNNVFKNAARSWGIDVTEVGRYFAENVEIYNNEFYNSPSGCICFAGRAIHIHDNTCDTARIFINAYFFDPVTNPMNNADSEVDWNNKDDGEDYVDVQICNNICYNTEKLIYWKRDSSVALPKVIQYKGILISDNYIESDKTGVTGTQPYQFVTIDVLCCNGGIIKNNYISVKNLSQDNVNKPAILITAYSTALTCKGVFKVKNNFYDNEGLNKDFFVQVINYSPTDIEGFEVDIFNNTINKEGARINTSGNYLKVLNNVYLYYGYGSTSKRPTPVNDGGTVMPVDIGKSYFDTTLGKPIFIKGISGTNITWVESDGALAGVLRSGTTANRPVGSSIYQGFAYYDTDLKKTIYANSISDNNVTWVEYDGAIAGVKRTGSSSQRPVYTDIYRGFVFYMNNCKIDTDPTSATFLQIVREAGPGLVALTFRNHDTTDPNNPVDIWVDPFGRVVS